MLFFQNCGGFKSEFLQSSLCDSSSESCGPLNPEPELLDSDRCDGNPGNCEVAEDQPDPVSPQPDPIKPAPSDPPPSPTSSKITSWNLTKKMLDEAIKVSNKAQLNNEVEKAKGGEIILLDSGEYGQLDINNKTYSSPVIIGSLKKSAPAQITMAYVKNSKNITFGGLRFMYKGPYKLSGLKGALDLDGSSQIQVLSSAFIGPTVGVGEYETRPDDRNVNNIELAGFGGGKGLNANNSKNIKVMNSSFFNLAVGSNASNSSDVSFIGNRYESLVQDAMNFSGGSNLLIEENYIGPFTKPPGLKHIDAIQFRMFSTPSKGIIIRKNTIVPGDSAYHAIYMGNAEIQANGFSNNLYQDITVTDNLIIAGHAHSLSVSDSIGVNIQNNVVVRDCALPARTGAQIPSILVGDRSTGVILKNNTTHVLRATRAWLKATTPSAWTVINNQIVDVSQCRNRPKM